MPCVAAAECQVKAELLPQVTNEDGLGGFHWDLNPVVINTNYLG